MELERLAERIRNTQAQSGLTGQAALDSRRSKVARVLGQEQKRTKNLLDMEYAAKAISADMWAKNASIFPYFQDVSLPKAGGQLAHLNRKLLSAISEVENPTLQRFLSVGIKQVQLKPMRHVDMESVYGSARVFSNALAAYGDVSKAMQIRSRWVRNPNPSARIKLAEEVKTPARQGFNMEKAGQWMTRATEYGPWCRSGHRAGRQRRGGRSSYLPALQPPTLAGWRLRLGQRKTSSTPSTSTTWW